MAVDDFSSERLKERRAVAGDATELEQLRGKVKYLEEQLKRVRPDARTEHLLRENRELRRATRNQRTQLRRDRLALDRAKDELVDARLGFQELLGHDGEMRDRVAEALGMPTGLAPLLWEDDIIQRALQVVRERGELVAELERVRPMARDLERMLMLLAVCGPACETCGTRATCFGGYEDSEHPQFACDTCCGHGCEDGWCIQIPQICGTCEGDGVIDVTGADIGAGALEATIPCPECSENHEPPAEAH